MNSPRHPCDPGVARSLLISLKYLQSPQRYASLATRLLFTGRVASIHHFHFFDVRRFLFGKHATPVTGTLVANGPSPTALMFCHASSRLPGFSICCPHSGKRGKCEAMNV